MAAPEDLGERGVVAVGEPGAVLGVGQEHVPQPPLARARLELLHDRRLAVRVAGLAQLALVHGLGREDVLLHEGVEALFEVEAAGAGLEVHRSPPDREWDLYETTRRSRRRVRGPNLTLYLSLSLVDKWLGSSDCGDKRRSDADFQR